MSPSEDQTIAIPAAPDVAHQTFRATVPALEARLSQPVALLDHGFIRVIDYMGDDNAIVQAARVSYGRGTRQVSQDTGLIRYLMRHRHTTPFEMCVIKFHVKLPIFVARQWIRHRMSSVNEYSARYSVMDREFYIPEPAQLAAQATLNRQGRDETLEGDEAARVLAMLRADAERCHDDYAWMLNEGSKDAPPDPDRRGLARELARMNLTLNTYTQWYWKTDLHNLFHFLSLRADAHAQYEIRVYAEAMLDLVAAWVPIAHQAFLDYRMGATSFSAPMMDVLRRMLAGEKVEQPGSGLSVREWREMMATLAAVG